jgi:hypothetical protein
LIDGGRMLLGARMEHGSQRMEEIKGNYYLMSEYFMGGRKNERWEEFLAGKADYISAFVLLWP